MAYYPAPALGTAALDDLYKLLAAGRQFVAFDFETTGLSPANDRIVEIGAVRFELFEADGRWQQRLLDSYATLVNPGRPIPGQASAVHGIYDLDVSGAPAFAEAATSFFPFLTDAVLIAHNASFDSGFLSAEAERARLPCPDNPVYDTIPLARAARPRLPSYALGKLAASFGIRQSAAHRGEDDARVCMEIFCRCVNLLFD